MIASPHTFHTETQRKCGAAVHMAISTSLGVEIKLGNLGENLPEKEAKLKFDGLAVQFTNLLWVLLAPRPKTVEN